MGVNPKLYNIVRYKETHMNNDASLCHARVAFMLALKMDNTGLVLLVGVLYFFWHTMGGSHTECPNMSKLLSHVVFGCVWSSLYLCTAVPFCNPWGQAPSWI